VGSQGRALSRLSQRAKFPFDFPVPRKGKSTKIDFQRVRSRAIPCGHWPLMKTNLRIGFQFYD